MHSSYTSSSLVIQKKRYIFLVFLTIICCLWIHLCTTSVQAEQPEHITERVRDLLVQHHYRGIREEELNNKSISDMIAYIDDPYTQYLEPEKGNLQLDQKKPNQDTVENHSTVDHRAEEQDAQSVRFHSMGSGIGYVQIYDFSDQAGTQFDQAIDQLESNGLNTLILDLRNNPGGFLLAASQIFSRFVHSDILYYANNARTYQVAMLAQSTRQPLEIPVYILMNEESASASELLAGALQDYQVAQIIGNQSFGKGVMQDFFTLENGAVLKITTDEYVTPLKKKVDKIGITPDYNVSYELAQSITTLRLAGLKSFVIQLKATVINIHGLILPNLDDIVRKNNKAYHCISILSALTDTTWTSTQQGKRLVLNATNHRTSISLSENEWYTENERMYVDMASIAKKIPGISLQMDSEAVTLTVSERK